MRRRNAAGKMLEAGCARSSPVPTHPISPHRRREVACRGRLRVPACPASNTQLAVLAVAERAAELDAADSRTKPDPFAGEVDPPVSDEEPSRQPQCRTISRTDVRVTRRRETDAVRRPLAARAGRCSALAFGGFGVSSGPVSGHRRRGRADRRGGRKGFVIRRGSRLSGPFRSARPSTCLRRPGR